MSNQRTTTITSFIGNNSLSWGVARTDEGSVPGRPPDRLAAGPAAESAIGTSGGTNERVDSGDQETEDHVVTHELYNDSETIPMEEADNNSSTNQLSLNRPNENHDHEDYFIIKSEASADLSQNLASVPSPTQAEDGEAQLPPFVQRFVQAVDSPSQPVSEEENHSSEGGDEVGRLRVNVVPQQEPTVREPPAASVDSDLFKKFLQYRYAEFPFEISMMELKMLIRGISEDDKNRISRRYHDHGLVPPTAFDWLSDNLLYSLMCCIAQQHNSSYVAFVPSTKLRDNAEYSDLAEMVRKASAVAVPLLQNRNHWVLVVIDKNIKCMYYFDPNTNITPKRISNISFVNKETTKNFLEKNLGMNVMKLDVKSVKHATQQDDSSCGVFVCFYLWQWLAGKPLIDAPNTDELRLQIYKELVQFCSVGRLGNDELFKCPIGASMASSQK